MVFDLNQLGSKKFENTVAALIRLALARFKVNPLPKGFSLVLVFRCFTG